MASQSVYCVGLDILTFNLSFCVLNNEISSRMRSRLSHCWFWMILLHLKNFWNDCWLLPVGLQADWNSIWHHSNPQFAVWCIKAVPPFQIPVTTNGFGFLSKSPFSTDTLNFILSLQSSNTSKLWNGERRERKRGRESERQKEKRDSTTMPLMAFWLHRIQMHAIQTFGLPLSHQFAIRCKANPHPCRDIIRKQQITQMQTNNHFIYISPELLKLYVFHFSRNSIRLPSSCKSKMEMIQPISDLSSNDKLHSIRWVARNSLLNIKRTSSIERWLGCVDSSLFSIDFDLV